MSPEGYTHAAGKKELRVTLVFSNELLESLTLQLGTRDNQSQRARKYLMDLVESDLESTKD